tara:strand:+ start:211 stop:327 length:117 start_codon:yes stop_codon:yes gene_type:complete
MVTSFAAESLGFPAAKLEAATGLQEWTMPHLEALKVVA